MSTITFTFTGLCALFTKKLGYKKNRRLMVGLMDLSEFDAKAEDFHLPTVTIINESSHSTIMRYENFSGSAGLYGDIVFDIPTKPNNLRTGLHFEEIVDIQSGPTSATAGADKCKTRFHFKHGELSVSEADRYKIKFNNEIQTRAVTTRLKIKVPDSKYAVLIFKNATTPGFVFNSGVDYSVHVEHEYADKPEGIPAGNHFQFYYKLTDGGTGSSPTWQDKSGPKTPTFDNAFCLNAKLSKADFTSVNS